LQGRIPETTPGRLSEAGISSVQLFHASGGGVKFHRRGKHNRVRKKQDPLPYSGSAVNADVDGVQERTAGRMLLDEWDVIRPCDGRVIH